MFYFYGHSMYVSHIAISWLRYNDAYEPKEEDQPVPLTQAEINDLIRDLNLSKESVQLLGSCLEEKHLLAPGTMFYGYRGCERELRQFFTFQDKLSLVYCNNIAGWIKSMGLEFVTMEGTLTHPAEVSKRFFYIMGIVFHLCQCTQNGIYVL